MDMRYRALIGYEGTNYAGFQRQQGQATIQEELEQSIKRVTDQTVTITGAGRTDAGVHASGQVVAFEVKWNHASKALRNALNANLPEEIVVLEINEVSENFHPRYDAQSRSYRYQIFNHQVRSPLHRHHSWHVKKKLNVELMNEAAEKVIGKHDFATFGSAPQGTNTIREVHSAEWRKFGDLICFDIAANAFLFRMVRSLVGSLKLVGECTWTVKEFEEVLASCDRGKAGKTAPANGLFLRSVTY